MPDSKLKEELTNHKEQIQRLVRLLDIAFAQGAKSSTTKEDRIVFPLGVACRDIMEEILFAVSNGFGRLALRSTRTMYECVVFSRYISLHPEMTDDYLATFHAQWALVLHNIPDAANGMPDVHKTVSQMVPNYAAGKRVTLEWSDKSTLQMAEAVGISKGFHAWAFNYASGFVHPSAVFLLRHLTQGEGGLIQISAASQDDESRLALRLSHALILNAVGLRMHYSPSDALTKALDDCKQDFQSIWGCPNPI